MQSTNCCKERLHLQHKGLKNIRFANIRPLTFVGLLLLFLRPKTPPGFIYHTSRFFYFKSWKNPPQGELLFRAANRRPAVTKMSMRARLAIKKPQKLADDLRIPYLADES